MAWDDTKGTGDTLTASEWNTHVTDQKGHKSRHIIGGSDELNLSTIIQTVSTKNGSVLTGTTAMILDDTIPQNTEGDEYFTLAITPKSSTSYLRIKLTLYISNSSVAWGIAGIFQDSIANALATGVQYLPIATALSILTIDFIVASSSTTARTYKVRAGGHTGTTTINGVSGTTRYFGGTLYSSLVIQEFYP
jgi:hypothetical protein